MKKITFAGLAALLTLSLTLSSCRGDDEPEIVIPEPEPEPVERTFKSLVPDTLAFQVESPVALRFSTTPWNLPSLDGASATVCDADCEPYEYAKAGQFTMLPDSTWSVSVQFDKGARRGDVIRIGLCHTDTVMYSKPIVLEVSSAEHFIEVMGSDTITFDEGAYPTVHLYTNPWNLIVPDSVPLNVYTAGDSLYPYASVVRRKLEKDNTWTVTIRLEYGMKDGDVIRLGVADSTEMLYTQPLVLDQIPAVEVGAFIMNIVSGPTSAYETGGSARIRFRMNPWDLLFDPETEVVATDTLGAPTAKVTLSDEIEFLPDSSWVMKATLPKGTGATICLAVVKGDTLCMSEKVDIRKVTISLSSVKVGSSSLTLDKKTYTYSAILPTVTDFSAMELSVSHTLDSVTVDGVKLTGTMTADLSAPVTLRAWKYDIYREFTVSVRNTGLPVVFITTPKTISSKKVWVAGCTIRIELPDGTVNLEDTLSMRGRGNNTWTYNKKPYALRMDGRTKVLGMHKHKRWILLANYKDRTLMRNDATFWLSQHTDLNYSIHGQFVELVMNGKHVGNYYLCEQAKIDKNRIAISEPNALDPENSGYLVEIDMYYDDDRNELKNSGADVRYFGFRSDKFKIPYQFKQPDREEMTQEALNFFKGVINDFETVLKDETRIKNHEYEQYIDVDQAIDYMLVNELAGNHDFYNTYPTAGPHSTYIYYDAANDRKLCYGPGWDFDYHTYMPSRSTGWIGLTAHKEDNGGGWGWGDPGGWGGWNPGGWGGTTQNDDYYYYFMLKDPKFKNRVIERWDMQKETFHQLPAYIDSMANYLRDSEAANYKVWGAINNQNGDENEDQSMTFQGAIDKMKKGFEQRWQWIDENIRKL